MILDLLFFHIFTDYIIALHVFCIKKLDVRGRETITGITFPLLNGWNVFFLDLVIVKYALVK